MDQPHVYHQDTHGQAYNLIALNDRDHDDCLQGQLLCVYTYSYSYTFSVSYLQVALLLSKSHYHCNANQWVLFIQLARLGIIYKQQFQLVDYETNLLESHLSTFKCFGAISMYIIFFNFSLYRVASYTMLHNITVCKVKHSSINSIHKRHTLHIMNDAHIYMQLVINYICICNIFSTFIT